MEIEASDLHPVNLNLSWAPYQLPYAPGTYIAFPNHIKDIIRATDKEIGGVILFSKPEIHADRKLLLANSIFLTAGEIGDVDWTRTLTTIQHGSFMMFHTHPKDNRGYQGYSSQDLHLLLMYSLKTYKHNVPVHFCLSTGKDIHFTFIDPVIMKLIRTIMKLMKPNFIKKFPGAIHTVFEEAFIDYFGCMFDALEYEFVKTNGTKASPDQWCLTLLDTFTFTPLDKYDIIKGLVKSYLTTPNGLKYSTNPHVMTIYEMYEDTFNKLVLEIPQIKTEADFRGLRSYLGLFKTTSQKYDKFFSDLHGGPFSGVQCLDGGRIYDETDPWSLSDNIHIESISPFALSDSHLMQGGTLQKGTLRKSSILKKKTRKYKKA